MRPVLPVVVFVLYEPAVCFMNEGSRLQHVSGLSVRNWPRASFFSSG
jgi:hypothetical protein